MRRFLVVLTVLVGCWTASKPSTTPKKSVESASTGGAAYGGEAYGGAQYARSAGILGAAAQTQGGAFASLTGTGDISSGFDDANIYGGLLGDDADDQNGGLGFGRSGFGSGSGGGGTGWGTIGTGRYGTIGHGSNSGGVGGGRGGMRGRTADVPSVKIGQPTATGDLDKAIIRRYVKRNIQKIQYCYEKELLAKPTLAGTVTVDFTIGSDGKVVKSKGAGIPVVADCVAHVIQGIEFPKPKSPTVTVTYPLIFATGSQP
jgi:hypothetical protein